MTKPPQPGNQQPLPSRELVEQLFAETETVTSLVYCFPKQLINCFKSIEGGATPSLLDRDSVARELELTEHAVSFDQVAFRYHLATETPSVVNFRYLGDAPQPISPEYLKHAGSKTPEAAANEFNAVFETHHLHVQGYCGWLLQQDEYWQDLKTVIGLFGDQLIDEMLPQQVFLKPDGANLVDQGDIAAEAFQHFCRKWRLQGLATLDLPIVIEPQLTPNNLYTPNVPPGCVSPLLPDIFPLDSTKPISKSLDQARLGIESPHLTEWKELIAVNSRKKRTIHRLAYEFRLQHYWRILSQRYPKQIHKRKSAVVEAFARYLSDKAVRTIESDAQRIADLLDRPMSTQL